MESITSWFSYSQWNLLELRPTKRTTVLFRMLLILNYSFIYVLFLCMFDWNHELCFVLFSFPFFASYDWFLLFILMNHYINLQSIYIFIYTHAKIATISFLAYSHIFLPRKMGPRRKKHAIYLLKKATFIFKHLVCY